jgi:DNA-binding transcriptional ArsR family regulator
MPSSRPEMGAIRGIQKALRDARKEERALKARIQRLEDSEAMLRGEAPASARKRRRRVKRAAVLDYLLEHPGSHYTDMAEAFDVPPNTIGSHLSGAKKEGIVENDRERWSVIKGKWPVIKKVADQGG